MPPIPILHPSRVPVINSYRRGKQFSNDVDIVISRRGSDEKDMDHVCQYLVSQLQESGMSCTTFSSFLSVCLIHTYCRNHYSHRLNHSSYTSVIVDKIRCLFLEVLIRNLAGDCLDLSSWTSSHGLFSSKRVSGGPNECVTSNDFGEHSHI